MTADWPGRTQAVLAKHWYCKNGISTVRCGGCDWSSCELGRHGPTLHAAHVMAEVEKSGLAATEREERSTDPSSCAYHPCNCLMEERDCTPWREVTE